MQQLTFLTGGDAVYPKLSGDGEVIAYLTFPEEDAGWLARTELMWKELAGGPAKRLRGPLGSLLYSGLFDLSDDGSTIAIHGGGDPLGRNPDGGAEVFVIDLDEPARIRPGAAAPTVVAWDVEPSWLLYDVIRGDVANLQAGGGAVDLGSVVCVENDSPNANTAGSEDTLQPAPGQVLFYLYRGIDDIDLGTGSYGRSNAGDERLPAAGDCSTIVL